MKMRNVFHRILQNQLSHMRKSNNSPRRSQRVRKSTIPNDYQVYASEEIQMEGDPTLFEKAMRSTHSSKWLEAMKDETRSMSTNDVWDIEEITKGAK